METLLYIEFCLHLSNIAEGEPAVPAVVVAHIVPHQEELGQEEPHTVEVLLVVFGVDMAAGTVFAVVVAGTVVRIADNLVVVVGTWVGEGVLVVGTAE